MFYRNKKDSVVLLVTEDQSKIWPSIPLNSQVKVYNINSINKIFPALWIHKPNTLIIDYEFLDNETEKVIRRVRSNTLYKKIKICCLKQSSNYKTDSFLKVIGVDHLIYKNDFTYSGNRTV